MILLWQTWRYLQNAEFSLALRPASSTFTMMTEISAESMGSGRRKLQGVLDDLVQQSKETDEKLAWPVDLTEESAIEEAAKSLVELPNSIPSADLGGVKRKGYRVSPRKRKKRRKKELISASDESDGEQIPGSERHIPHVMTLFDRRVDLARFSDSTPLYVMCRDWMRNKPQRRQSCSVPGEKVNDDCHPPVSLSLPSPQPMPQGQSTNVPVAVSPYNTSDSLDQQMEQQQAAVNGDGCSVEHLKQQHLQRWKNIKSRWTSASVSDQERYRDSLKILRDMFQR